MPKQLTHVAGQGTSEVNPDSGKSGNKATSDSAVLKKVTQVAAKEGDSDLLIDSVEEAAKALSSTRDQRKYSQSTL